jgi:Zn-dependent protease
VSDTDNPYAGLSEIERRERQQADLLARQAVRTDPSADSGVGQAAASAGWPAPAVPPAGQPVTDVGQPGPGGQPPFYPPQGPNGGPMWTPVPQHYYMAPDQTQVQAHPQGTLERWRSKGGILGTLASILIVLAKIGAPAVTLLLKLKFVLVALGSMLISMWLWGKVFGWQFGVGIVLLICIHECGHALAARSRGIPTGFMVFIPFMGGLVATKRGGKNIEESAFIGIMGPVVGSLASLITVLIYVPTHNPFWLALGGWGFFVNLFNLFPTVPLDGGWIVPMFSPKLLLVGTVSGVILGIIFHIYNPMIWVLLVLSLPRALAGWKADPTTQPYYQVAPATRLAYGVSYLGLAALLALGQAYTNGVLAHLPIVAQ